VDLQAVVDHAEGGPLRGQLGDRHLPHRVAREVGAQRGIGHVAGGFDLGGDLGQLVADRLVVADRPPERASLQGKGQRPLKGRLHAPTAPRDISSRSHWKLAMIR